MKEKKKKKNKVNKENEENSISHKFNAVTESKIAQRK